MLEFKKYLKEVKKDYTPEEMSIFKNQLEEYNKNLSILENQKNNMLKNITKQEDDILKQKRKIEDIFSKD
jgi:hypothetical protein